MEDTFTVFEILTCLPHFPLGMNPSGIVTAWPVWAETIRCIGIFMIQFFFIVRQLKMRITAWLNVRTSVSRPWWRHQMKTFSALLALCAGNLPVPGEFPTQGPVTRSFDVFFDLRLNKRLNKQPWGWWFETPSWSLWRHCNDNDDILYSGGCFTSVNVSSTC